MKPPRICRPEIEARIREQLEAEETGDVDTLYDLVLPSIRERRERELDEPRISHTEWCEFLSFVKTARLHAFRVTDFCEVTERYGECPSVRVEYSAIYNGDTKASFDSRWVKCGGKWHTTALGKLWLPHDHSSA